MTKRIVFVLFALSLITYSCIGPIPKNRRVYSIGEIVEIFPLKKGSCNVVFYDTLMNMHKAHYPNMIPKLQLGEEYRIAYDKNDISYIDIYFTAPVIKDSLGFDVGNAVVVSSVLENFYNSNYCSFNYEYKGKRYKRYQYVVDRNFKIGDSTEILINKNNPKIAYVRGIRE